MNHKYQENLHVGHGRWKGGQGDRGTKNPLDFENFSKKWLVS